MTPERRRGPLLDGASLSGIDTRDVTSTVEGHVHDNDLLEHGYHGITSIFDITQT
jgi:hypothetical protein